MVAERHIRENDAVKGVWGLHICKFEPNATGWFGGGHFAERLIQNGNGGLHPLTACRLHDTVADGVVVFEITVCHNVPSLFSEQVCGMP